MSKSTVKLLNGKIKSIENWAAKEVVSNGLAEFVKAKTKDEPVKEVKTESKAKKTSK